MKYNVYARSNKIINKIKKKNMKTKTELFWEKVAKMTKKELIELIAKCVDYNDGELYNEFDREIVWKWCEGYYRTNFNGRNGALLTSLTKDELKRIAERCTRFIRCLSLV